MKYPNGKKNKLLPEAQAFDRRISERTAAGFIPDLRRAVKCDYFYKSFWRDPYFIKLYLGNHVSIFLELLEKYGGKNQKILDAGCGAGYISLELARAGHRVTGIDISSKAIEAAEKTLAENPFKKKFGSLNYKVSSLDKMADESKEHYDAILFSGILHHVKDAGDVLRKSAKLLNPNGLIVCGEPLHDKWGLADAAQAAFIRALLSLTGNWYEKSLGNLVLESKNKFSKYAEEVYTEYVTERDKDEKGGQSPNDNNSSGTQILKALRKNLKQLEYRDGPSFIYRMLGGLRGPEKEMYKIADILSLYDSFAVNRGYLKPNCFFFVGRKNNNIKIK